MITDEQILKKVITVFPSGFLETSPLVLVNNMGPQNTIAVQISPSAYRSNSSSKIVLMYVKTSGKLHYVAFNDKYRELAEKYGISYELKAAQGVIRIDIDVFCNFLDNFSQAASFLETIYIDLFNFQPFGCCGSYVKCSDLKRCVHPDPVYATACQYKKHLDGGRIFYGKNKNC